jgi:hypothetical protein
MKGTLEQTDREREKHNPENEKFAQNTKTSFNGGWAEGGKLNTWLRECDLQK